MAGKSDGTVYIDTRIDTSGIDKGMSATQRKVSSFSGALKKLGATIKNTFSGKIFDKGSNTAIENYDKQIKKLEAELDRLIEKQIRFVETGGNKKSRTMAGMEYDIEMVRTKLEELRLKQKQVAEGVNTKASSMQFLSLKDSLIKVGKAAGSAFGNILKFANNALNAGLRKLNSVFKKLSSHLFLVDKNAKKSNYSIVKMLGTSVLFSAVFRAISALTKGFEEGLLELAKHSDQLTDSLNSLKSALLQLRNSFISAFAPLIQEVIPYLEKFISYINQAFNYVAQFMAALMGQDTYKKALKVSASIDGTASSLDKVKDSANDAKKALQGYLSPLDEINRYTSQKTNVPDVGDNQLMFEDVPVDNMFKGMSDKFKTALSSLFAPLKQAWDNVGQLVMDSWIYALDNVWALIKDIGQDFLEVWNQAKTIAIFEDILSIIGDIGLVVGILMDNFREAWNYADTGKGILEGIRDIIGVITDNILQAADATVTWAKDIDFQPILTKMQEWIDSLVPVFDTLSGILSDFYVNVLLPLGEWVLEEGLPELLQILTDFNNEVDWEALRTRLNELWTHLEPFAETIGEGLLEFIDRVSDNLADFANSDEFDDFLTAIEDWMDSVEPSEVADGLENIVEAIIALKVASAGLSVISTLTTTLTGLFNIISLFKTPAFTTALANLSKISGIIAGWLPHIAVGAAIAEVFERIKKAVTERVDTSDWNLFDWITETLKLSLQGWQSEFDNFKIGLELWWQDTWLSNAIWNFEQWLNEKVIPFFTEEKWKEILENVKTAFSEKYAEIKEKVAESFQTIKDDIFKKLSEIKTEWDTKWEAFSNKVTTVWETIKTSISSAVDKIKGWIDDILSKFSDIKTKASNLWNNTIGSIEIPSFNFSSFDFGNVNIPKLATGTVIPPNAPFLAMLGDQRHGTNIEAPLSTIEQALENVYKRNGNNASGTLHNYIQIDGQTLLENIVDIARLTQMATGHNVFELT